MTESKFPWRKKIARGQSIVEFALMAPILLILLSGLFEFGFMFSHYLAVLDAARNAARFSSDSMYSTTDSILNCSTKDFYRQTACEAMENLLQEEPTITLCLPGAPATDDCDPGDFESMDDIIISVFSVERLYPAGESIVRFARGSACPEWGWSYAADLGGVSQCSTSRVDLHLSHFTTGDVSALLDKTDKATNTGFILVEINFNYNQILGLPWFTQFVGDPVPFNVYAFWTLTSAEPTSTP
jgi:hypothetical protein